MLLSQCLTLHKVALFTRAWIEITSGWNFFVHSFVALFTRAWIEIAVASSVLLRFLRSPSLRGRGLKYLVNNHFLLKTRSPSLRGRGLKSKSLPIFATENGSPSLRGRGLKYPTTPKKVTPKMVALFTRAWIEIQNYHIVFTKARCRPLYEGVD